MVKKRKYLQVVIAHPIPEERARIAALLKREGIFRVHHMTENGLDCLREVVSTQPDLLILDTVLDKVDGMEVLRRLREFPLTRTRCLAITSFKDYVKERALCLGADYCLIAPYADNVLVEAARMLLLPPESAVSDRELDEQTSRVLRDIGVPARLKAYPYVLHAVRILYRDPELVRRRCVVRELYGVIAQRFGVSLCQVERAMRTLSARALDKGDPEALARCFSSAELQRGHLTNTDLLVALTRLVSERLTDGRPGSAAEDR